MVSVCESSITFLCVNIPFICLSHYLLNHWAEFNQSCYITSPHGKVVRKQHHFTVRPSYLCLSVSLFSPKQLGGSNLSCYITSPHGKGVREHYYFYIRPPSVYLSVTLSPPKSLNGIQPNLLHHFPSWSACARAALCFHLSVRCLSICPSRYLHLNNWTVFNQT